jgi:ribonucleotide reductase beta subunit family protein with ferritin-like domain
MSEVHTYSLYPLSDIEMYKLGKEQEARFWSISDLKSFYIDREDYQHRASPQQKRILEKVMIDFVPIDGVVNSGHMKRTAKCKDQCEQYAMAMQIADEAVHAETYGLSAQVIFGNDKLKELKIEAEGTKAIKDKMAFGKKYAKKDKSQCEYLLGFACTEGIFISVSFIFIFWFRSKEMMPSLIHANSMISEDEMLHQKMANKRYLKYGGLPKEEAMAIIMEAMAIEERFIDWILPEAVDDLNPQDVKTYLKLVVDYQLVSIGLPKLYNVTNPFSWDSDRSLYKKPNPYERESGQYCRFSVDEVMKMVENIQTGTIKSDHLINPWATEGI